MNDDKIVKIEKEIDNIKLILEALTNKFDLYEKNTNEKFIDYENAIVEIEKVLLPIENNESEIVDCSDWFSDFKSASSVERVEAVIKLGRLDPVGYADETGPVSWDYVVNEVTKVLENHNN